MKSIRFFLLPLMLIAMSAVQAQNVTITVSGHVTDIQNQQPITGHQVFVTLYGDSINTFGSVDSVWTDLSGFYSVEVSSNFVQGTALVLSASTFDCQYMLQSQFFTYTGGTGSFTADFAICNDSVNPPAGCSNYIAVTGVQGLTVSFAGYLENQQQAFYTWEFGDGVSATGQFPVHAYASQGIYTVTLFTVSADSCTDFSQYTLILQDSLPSGCENYFTYSATGTPLEISFLGYTMSQYPASYSWDFSDPASGSANTSSLQNPFHTFTAAGDFAVTLTTVDSLNCSYTSTYLVTVSQGNPGDLAIFGFVNAGNSFLDYGTATLFGPDSLGMYTVLQVTTIDSGGYYGFYNLGEGNYLVQASPSAGSVYYNLYLPTYYGDVFLWEEAEPIVLGIPQNPYIINLAGYDSIGYGNGVINGQLISGGKAVSPSQQEVLLLSEADEPVKLTYTDEQGNFSFTSLPAGLYKVNPVITGFTTYPALVGINGTSAPVSVVMVINGQTITGMHDDKPAFSALSMYPNPVSSQLNIAVEALAGTEVMLRVMDASGRVILSKQSLAQSGEARISLDVSNLEPGIYYVQMTGNNGLMTTGRFVKN